MAPVGPAASPTPGAGAVAAPPRPKRLSDAAAAGEGGGAADLLGGGPDPGFWSNLPAASQVFVCLCIVGTAICLAYAVYLLTDAGVRERHGGLTADQLATFLIATAVAYVVLVLDAVAHENAFQLLLSVAFELAMALRAAWLILVDSRPTKFEVAILVVGAVLQVLIAVLARTTYRQFGWRIYSRCAVDTRESGAEDMRKRFVETQRVYTAIKLDAALLALTFLVGTSGAMYGKASKLRDHVPWLAALTVGVAANLVQAAFVLLAVRNESRPYLTAAVALAPFAVAYAGLCITAAVLQKTVSNDLSPAYMIIACVLFAANRLLILHTLRTRAQEWESAARRLAAHTTEVSAFSTARQDPSTPRVPPATSSSASSAQCSCASGTSNAFSFASAAAVIRRSLSHLTGRSTKAVGSDLARDPRATSHASAQSQALHNGGSPGPRLREAVAGSLSRTHDGPRLTFFTAAALVRSIARLKAGANAAKEQSERKRRLQRLTSLTLSERIKALPRALQPLVRGTWARKLSAKAYASLMGDSRDSRDSFASARILGRVPAAVSSYVTTGLARALGLTSVSSRRLHGKRRFFQLAADGTMLRWAWEKYVLLHYMDDVVSDEVSRTLCISFVLDVDQPLMLQFDDAKTHLAWAAGLTYMLGRGGAPLDLGDCQGADGEMEWTTELPSAEQLEAMLKPRRENELLSWFDPTTGQTTQRLSQHIDIDVLRKKSSRRNKPASPSALAPSLSTKRALEDAAAAMDMRSSSGSNLGGAKDVAVPIPDDGSGEDRQTPQRDVHVAADAVVVELEHDEAPSGEPSKGDAPAALAAEPVGNKSDDNVTTDTAAHSSAESGNAPMRTSPPPVRTKVDVAAAAAAAAADDDDGGGGGVGEAPGPELPRIDAKGAETPGSSLAGSTPFTPPSPRSAYRYYVAASLQVLRTSSLDVKLGKYLGGGAEGLVYTALLRGSPVVIKVTSPAEATLSAFATHPPHENVVAMRGVLFEEDLVDMAERSGIMYDEGSVGIVFEYCARGSLRSLIRHTKGALMKDPFKAVKLVQDIATAMAHLHYRAVPLLHRDLKTANIFVSRGLGLKVGDYGQARTLDAAADETAAAAMRSEGGVLQRSLTVGTVGTCAYAAPELISPPDAKTQTTVAEALAADVYSFGCVVYEMLTGTMPFDGRETWQIQADFALAIGETHPLNPNGKSLPRPPQSAGGGENGEMHPGRNALWSIVERCTRMDRRERPGFREVLAVLQAVSGGSGA